MSDKRFIVVYSDDPRVPDEDWCEGRWHLIDTFDDSLVASDGGEPEDQLLVRDWSWVPDKLNELDSELLQLRSAAKAREVAAREALVGMLDLCSHLYALNEAVAPDSNWRADPKLDVRCIRAARAWLGDES